MRAKKIALLVILLSLVSSPAVSSDGKSSVALNFLDEISIPDNVEPFQPVFHYPPVSQGTTWVCWSFATTSFVESEMKRLGHSPVKLSVMFTVYHAFIEKIIYFVQTRGQSRFYQGDLFNTAADVMQKYGAVPDSVYPGTLREDGSYHHTDLYRELHQFKHKLKTENHWDEAFAVEGIKKILDKHLGAPPEEFTFNDIVHTPKTFRDKVVNLPWGDYLMVTSFMYSPMDTFTDLRVPDNWKNDKRFFNVPLDVFYEGIKNSMKNGFSVAVNLDNVDEPGRDADRDVMIVPDFDIPLEHITQQAREYRFEIGMTTDEHLVHLLGYSHFNGEDWFLTKDSWPTSWNGSQKGYYFIHESYVKLKFLSYLVHKDGVPGIVSRIKSSSALGE